MTYALCKGLCSDPGELNSPVWLFGELFTELTLVALIVGVWGELLLRSCLRSNGNAGGFERRCSVRRERNCAGLSSGRRVWTIWKKTSTRSSAKLCVQGKKS